ncbi:hypothetical protein BDB00DRAFT_786910 [Zychaea mexicana]|uniref:uncharacterized protein n=1 Tax=Zychaea mexicana TaxID=64656 RepID=UPI0022FE233D|nr:uncharacterized protein BDB00DRAFT_786910 [Zychaea mexicana]KAI9494805.1 hypothetical protein BDB00DRAFT_786910 [Zychaea mexicana]
MYPKLILLVLYIAAITCHAAIIPEYGDAVDSNSSGDLESDAAAFLNEDVLINNNNNNDIVSEQQEPAVMMSSITDSTTEDQLQEDDTADDEFLHVHQKDGEQDIVYEGVHYTLNEDGRFVIVQEGVVPIAIHTTASSEQEAIRLFEEYAVAGATDDDDDDGDELEFADEQDDISGEQGPSYAKSQQEDEEGEDISEHVESILFDNADSVTIDPDTGLPMFKNKNTDDFDFYRQIPEPGESLDTIDDDDDEQVGAAVVAADEAPEEALFVDQSSANNPAMVIHRRPHKDKVDPGNFYQHTRSRYQSPPSKKSTAAAAAAGSHWQRHFWKYFAGVAILVLILVRRSSGAAQLSSSEAIATHHDWRKQLNYKYDQAAARLPVYYTQDLGREFTTTHNDSSPVVLDEKSGLSAGYHHSSNARRASAGHVRKLSTGSASARSQNVRLQHQRHTSLSSINSAALYRYSNGGTP